MKKIILMSLTLALFAGCEKKEPAPAGGTESEATSRVKHGPKSETIVALDEATQKKIGLKTETLAPAQLSPEVKGYGRVVDPAPLASLVADYTTAQAASAASQAELNRLKTLAAQNNASERALQAAEAAAARDKAQLESLRLKSLASWGEAIVQRQDLPAFVQSLAMMKNALARIDLPAGESLKSPPAKARLVTLSDETVAAEFLGVAPMVDPQTQSQGVLLLIQPNALKLGPGAAVTGFLQVAGEPVKGFLVPRSAVLRYEGGAWIYVESDGTNFIRRAIAPQHPLENGWFIPGGVTAGDQVVTVGAQAVFSEELNSSGFKSGGRD
jgi:hypothetical protein